MYLRHRIDPHPVEGRMRKFSLLCHVHHIDGQIPCEELPYKEAVDLHRFKLVRKAFFRKSLGDAL